MRLGYLWQVVSCLRRVCSQNVALLVVVSDLDGSSAARLTNDCGRALVIILGEMHGRFGRKFELITHVAVNEQVKLRSLWLLRDEVVQNPTS